MSDPVDNWNYKLDSPPGVNPEDIVASFKSEGRYSLGIYPPNLLGHYTQRLAAEYGDYADEVMAGLNIDEETAHRIAVRLITRGLRYLVGMAEFGYAERVLEERAGLPPLPDSTHRAS